ncbi:hypothetical protein M8H41_04795 [Desulfosporosinus nitroreducens]|uniref:Uncharacterized protein n=1 Tax=Desulfosporosinus nitroreducens TaxID=2018668 RepID=A0ABT8QLF0_9FIRM|nr:hypothetical protein [Desulfosporosinus nitroreducens]MDO0822172.1 hypothetical protein [Desulfosporosinus nitroreducens]
MARVPITGWIPNDGSNGKIIAEPVRRETVAEPFETERSKATKKGTNTAGREVAAIRVPRYVPTPEALRTAPKAPAAPVARIINPELSTALSNHE